MTLSDQELTQIREVVRAELRREEQGIRCPECGARHMTAEEWDAYDTLDGEVWACNCGYEAPPTEYVNTTP